MTTRDKVRKIIAEQTGNWVFKDSATFTEIGADSLDTVEIVMACEDEFDICIDDHDTCNVKTADGLIAVVEKYLSEKSK